MKKYIPILLVTSLLLSACSIDWNDEKDKKITELQAEIENDVFKKKQECQKYQEEVERRIQKSEKELNDIWDHYNETINEIFYSKSKKTCYALISSLWIREKKANDIERYNIILDILSNDSTNYRLNDKDTMAQYYIKIRELKWE